MKRPLRLWAVALFVLTLTACAAKVSQLPDSGSAVPSPEAAVSTETGQATEEEQSNAAEEVPDAPEQSPEAPETNATNTEAETPVGNPHELTAEELQTWSDFLSQDDCYGFLMSEYATPLDADLGQVFYTGAGVGEYPSEEMTADYLKDNDFEEAYTDITFIPYDAANEILERRTGYTLEHFKLAGNDIPMYYSQKYAGYFQMAGDTNRIRVECVSGEENADGSIFLKSREKSWSDAPDEDDTSLNSFETMLRPDFQSGNMTFEKNVITGGWLLWLRDFEDDEPLKE